MLQKTTYNDPTPVPTSRKRKIGTTVIAIIAVFIAITAVAWFSAAGASDGGNPGSPSYRDTVGYFIQSINDADVRSLFQLVPAELIDSYLTEENIEKRDLMELVQQELDLTHENLVELYGEEWNISHEITETRQVIEDELLELQKEYEELELEISEAIVVDLNLTIEAKDITEDSTIQMLLLKISGSWYITGDFLEKISE
jgi:hypothetical protein